MGSLMAGWNSPSLKDPHTVELERNKSLTKEEIENFHKFQMNLDGDESSDSLHIKKEDLLEEREIKRDSNVPTTPNPSPVERKIEDWWTMTKSAFLNEPPCEKNESANTYIAQFHVAKFSNEEARLMGK